MTLRQLGRYQDDDGTTETGEPQQLEEDEWSYPVASWPRAGVLAMKTG